MLSIIQRLLIAPLVLTLVGCGIAEPRISTEESSVKVDILQRLNSEGSFEWVADRFAPVTESNVENIYTTTGCSIWVFASGDEATIADEAGTFSFYDGEVWYGTDPYGSKGVVLLTSSKDSSCAKVVFNLLNWTTETEDKTAPPAEAGMSGKWGSDSWMGDSVGMFLKVKEIGRDQYLGTFYSQGQSGGIFKDFSVDIIDIGDGMAEVTWPSGNTTIATWGKRDESTPKNMDPNWNGDIWFDCVGEADFAQSRADCNFYWAGER